MLTPFLAALVLATQATDSLPWLRVQRGGLDVRYTAVDSAAVRALLPMLEEGRRTAEQFFGAPFTTPFVIRVFPDRAALTEHWRRAWNVPDLEPQCWMVASGTAADLSVLSPRAWRAEACEHDPADAGHTARILAHELVHVYHAQRSPHPDFEGMDPVGWFVEGVAVLASGQLQAEHTGAATRAVAEGRVPAQLEDVWSGRYRYGVAGSLVGYVDRRWGRAMTVRLLGMVTEAEMLAALGVTESLLLEEWRGQVTVSSARQ
jgi:hypothetical protein